MNRRPVRRDQAARHVVTHRPAAVRKPRVTYPRPPRSPAGGDTPGLRPTALPGPPPRAGRDFVHLHAVDGRPAERQTSAKTKEPAFRPALSFRRDASAPHPPPNPARAARQRSPFTGAIGARRGGML